MNMKFGSIIALLLLFITGEISAQQAGSVGFGFGLSGSTWVGVIYHPFPSFALRPSVHFRLGGGESNYKNDAQGTTVIHATSESLGLGVGLAALWDLSVSDDLTPYLGTGFTYLRNVTDSENRYVGLMDTTMTRTETNLVTTYSGVLGMRYMVAKRFHVFGELAAGYSRNTQFSEPSTLQGPENWSFSLSSSSLGAYFYFN